MILPTSWPGSPTREEHVTSAEAAGFDLLCLSSDLEVSKKNVHEAAVAVWKPTRFTGNADTIRSPNELHGLFIDPHQPDGIDEGQNLAVEATSSDLRHRQTTAEL